jgi:hypothetical protein
MPLKRFIEVAGAFDEETTAELGKAFDKVCALLGRSPQPTAVREAIARNIVEAAKQGERDPERLRDAGLAAMQEYVGKGN